MRLLVALAFLLALPAQAAALDLGLGVQRKAFAGYPIIASVRAGGVANGETVSVQRLAGAAWRDVAPATIRQERGEAVFTLPKGRVRLRAAVAAETSPERAISVVRARHWTTTGDAGTYRGKAEGARLALKVASGGRRIRDFDTSVTMFCVGATIPQNHFLVGIAPVKRARIAPDGRFYTRVEHGSNTVIELRGRVRHHRVKGQVRLTVGTCDGVADYGAKLRR